MEAGPSTPYPNSYNDILGAFVDSFCTDCTNTAGQEQSPLELALPNHLQGLAKVVLAEAASAPWLIWDKA